jgi:hypothetical protein
VKLLSTWQLQDVTWLVFVKTFWTRTISVFFLGQHYHRICHQLNICGMNSVDVFATVKIHQKHYGSCVTHLCTSGTTSHNPISNDWLVLWVAEANHQYYVEFMLLNLLFSVFFRPLFVYMGFSFIILLFVLRYMASDYLFVYFIATKVVCLDEVTL